MPSQNGNGGRGNPWGSGANASPPDLDALVRQGQDRLQQILPGGGGRGIGVVVVLLSPVVPGNRIEYDQS